jgi:hypothetical protein
VRYGGNPGVGAGEVTGVCGSPVLTTVGVPHAEIMSAVAGKHQPMAFLPRAMRTA